LGYRSNLILSLLIRNLIFTILYPGFVVGVFPYLIAKTDFQNAFSSSFKFYFILGFIAFLFGLIILLHCILNFAIVGKGTLSPLDPTKQLVIKGLYKYSRNPMYVGVMLMLIGECLVTMSVPLLVYSGFVFIFFNLFVILMEEPRLSKTFGKAYNDYKQSVRRWF